jgi:hypothetical protein
MQSSVEKELIEALTEMFNDGFDCHSYGREMLHQIKFEDLLEVINNEQALERVLVTFKNNVAIFLKEAAARDIENV